MIRKNILCKHKPPVYINIGIRIILQHILLYCIYNIIYISNIYITYTYKLESDEYMLALLRYTFI